MKHRLAARKSAVLIAVSTCLGTGALALAPSLWVAWILLLTIPWLFPTYRFFKGNLAGRFGAHAQADGAVFAEVHRSTIEALASAIAAKDSYTPRHVNRMQRICELVAGQLRLDPHSIEGIRIASLVQDVGKLGVPDYILLKPGPLDPEEFSKVSNHAAIGAGILERVSFPWNVAEMVRHHHEKHDGTGYPDHLAGNRIPLGSRIIAVASVYEALISKRCYKECWSHHKAVAHIEKLSGTHFDPRVVEAFLKVEPEVASLGKSPQLERPGDCSGPGPDFDAAEVIGQANRELVSLFEIAQTLSSTLEIDEVLALLAHRNRRLLQAATCAVFLVEESHPGTLVARVAVGRHQEIFRGAQARLGKGVTGKAASRERPYVGNYDPNDLVFGPEAEAPSDMKSCAVAPVVGFGQVLGTINLYDVSSHAFSEDDLRVLALVAQQAALAVKNASAFEKVRESAMRDPLTNLHNGRYLRHCLEQELSRASRLGEPLSVLGMDLDNFKKVNDSCGHNVGDEVLGDVADILRSQLRDYDVAARTGGDEFVVVLPETPPSEAWRTGERIRREIARYAQQTLSDADLGFGVSMGVASYPYDAGDLETLLARADAAMYRDKRARKQRFLAA